MRRERHQLCEIRAKKESCLPENHCTLLVLVKFMSGLSEFLANMEVCLQKLISAKTFEIMTKIIGENQI